MIVSPIIHYHFVAFLLVLVVCHSILFVFIGVYIRIECRFFDLDQVSVDNELADHIEEKTSFPECFPGGVPPEGAVAPNGEYFRITNKRKPTKACFLADYQKDLDDVLTRPDFIKICSFGISLQNSLEGAKETIGRFKNATMKRYIAKANLPPDVGLIMQTLDVQYHHTLWTYTGVELSPLFKCVEMVEPK